MQDTVLANQVGVSVLTVYVLQALKRAPWFPWIKQNTDRLNRGLAVLIAFLTAAGFQFSMQGSWQAGRTVTVVIPSVGVLWTVLLHALAQTGMQESFYHGIVKKADPDKR
jgi:hypothetical protein